MLSNKTLSIRINSEEFTIYYGTDIDLPDKNDDICTMCTQHVPIKNGEGGILKHFIQISNIRDEYGNDLDSGKYNVIEKVLLRYFKKFTTGKDTCTECFLKHLDKIDGKSITTKS